MNNPKEERWIYTLPACDLFLGKGKGFTKHLVATQQIKVFRHKEIKGIRISKFSLMEFIRNNEGYLERNERL